MPSAKARYTGDGSGSVPPGFSTKLRKQLENLCPESPDRPDHERDAFVGEFVEAILAEAWWMVSEIRQHKFDLTKQEIRAEQDDLLKLCCKLEEKLRKLTPDFDRLLGVDAEPLDLADRLMMFCKQIERSGVHLEDLPRRPRIDERQHRAAVEGTIRIMRVVKDYGLQVTGTCNHGFGYISVAVEIMKAVGDDICLVLEKMTWRDIIIEAKKEAPDLDR